MRLTLILIAIFISITGYTQNKRVVVKFSPLSLVDGISFPTIQGGFEISLSKKVSWYNELGFKYRKTYSEKTDTSFLSTKGFKAKTEVRYYLKDSKSSNSSRRLEGGYLAANVFYINDVHNASLEYFYQHDSSSRMADNFGVNKTIWGTNFLAGNQLTVIRNFLLDGYTGLGIRYRNITTINKEFDNRRDDLRKPLDVTVEGFKSIAEARGGKNILPNFTLGLRLCYRF